MKMAFHARRDFYSDRISLLIGERNADGELSAAAHPIVMQAVEPGSYCDTPAMSLDAIEAQGLMDELWRAGLRPTEGVGSAGSLAATERHLADMRGIALSLLGMGANG